MFEMDPDLTHITDYERLFRSSSLVDSLRDASRVILRHPTDSQTAALLAAQYKELREELVKTLRDDLGAETYRWAPELPDGATIPTIFAAACQLGRWIDTILQTPSFMLNRRLAEKQMKDSAAQFLTPAGPVTAQSAGSYL